jgi:protein-lysine N-methyltransferase EEF2KMT
MEHMGNLSVIPTQDQFEEAQQMQIQSYYPPLPFEQPGVQPVLINEARNLLSRGTNVGLRTWEAALHLAWYLLMQRPELIRNKNVLELGAGTGFLSLLCAGHLKAQHVLATDGLSQVCESLQANVDLNVKHNTVPSHRAPEVLQLDWTDRPGIDQLLRDTRTISHRQYDLVIGADITYHPDILKPLAELLSILKDDFPDVIILISATIRSDTFSQFTTICQQEFKFTVTEEVVDIPTGLRYSGFFHSVATPIKVVSLRR